MKAQTSGMGGLGYAPEHDLYGESPSAAAVNEVSIDTLRGHGHRVFRSVTTGRLYVQKMN